MKKAFLLLAFLCASVCAQAQDIVPTKRLSVATNSFWSNWFVGAGLQASAAYTSEEAAGVKFNPFSNTRASIGFNVALGKWFTPSIGLRTQFNGISMKAVQTKDLHRHFTYFNLHEDLLLNLSNLFCGYNARRVWNVVPWGGVGYMRNATRNTNDVSFNFGVINKWRLASRLSLALDIYVTAARGKLDERNVQYNDNWAHHKVGALRHWDKQLSVSLSLTYHIGKHRWDYTPDVQALSDMNREQLEALQTTIDELQAENERLYAEAAPSEATPLPEPAKADTVIAAPTLSVFFSIGSADIENRQQLVAVKELVDFARLHNATLVVSGYADAQTGQEVSNLQLACQRAEALARELVKMGQPQDKVLVEDGGISDALSPFSYNRRATVRLQK